MPSLPQATIHSVLDSSYNPTLIAGFLYGVYTLFLFQTLWKLYQMGGKTRYSTTLLLLWFCCIVDFLIQWVGNRNAFVLDSKTSVGIAVAILTPKTGLENIPLTVGTIVADGIIIWRCNILWGKRWILCLLSFMLSATLAFGLAASILPDSHGFAGLLAAVYFCTSAATNIVATSFICIKIISTTRRNEMKYSYSQVVQILVQSAAMTTVMTLALGILILIPHIRRISLNTGFGRAFEQAGNYISSLEAPIVGLAPTLLAVRVIESQTEDNNPGTTPPAQLSRLTFRRTAQEGQSSLGSSYSHTEGFMAQGDSLGRSGKDEQVSDVESAKDASNSEKNIDN